MQADQRQENPTRPVPGFSLLDRQGQPDRGPLLSEMDRCYEDGRPIPYFENNVDKERFPEVWATVESAHEALKVKARGTAISEAERHRLVEAAKCPTQGITPEIAERDHQHRVRFDAQRELRGWVEQQGGDWAEFHNPETRILPETKGSFSHAGQHYGFDQMDFETGEVLPGTAKRQSEGGAACYAVLTHRTWSDEYRFRTQVEQPHQLPPEQSGDRITSNLSERGARTIADSCYYMHLEKGGYRTFLTLTLDEAGRSRVEIRQAEGPCIEVQQIGKRYRAVSRPEKPESGTHWVDKVKLPKLAANDGPFTPVDWVEGLPVAAATREAGADMTFQSIQKEISRFLDGLQKMKKRGWTASKTYEHGPVVGIRGAMADKSMSVVRKHRNTITCYEREGVAVGEGPSAVVGLKYKKPSKKHYLNKKSIDCHGENLGYLADKRINVQRQSVGYCWVVENPLNERGQRNPHVHILLDWRVKWSAFPSWADRVESLWGQGFAHLEKIKDSELAGGYMAKAAGYLSKANGEESDQGPVRGNRYGVSSWSRAPGWACIGRYEMSVMGHMIKDVSDYFTHLYGHVYAKRTKLKKAMEDTPREDKKTRSRIGATLAKVRSAISRLPAIASPYQIVIKGADRAREFWKWATTDKPVEGGDWLPAKDAGDSWNPDQPKPEGLHLKEFQNRLFHRKAGRRWAGMPLAVYKDWIEPEADRSSWRQGWFEYQGLGGAA